MRASLSEIKNRTAPRHCGTGNYTGAHTGTLPDFAGPATQGSKPRSQGADRHARLWWRQPTPTCSKAESSQPAQKGGRRQGSNLQSSLKGGSSPKQKSRPRRHAEATGSHPLAGQAEEGAIITEIQSPTSKPAVESPSDLGANPSLTVLALAENRTMSIGSRLPRAGLQLWCTKG